MTDRPDPQTVRQLATEHILDDARRAHDIGADVLGHHGVGILTKHEYGDWCSAVRQAIASATVTVSWPDEKAQDEPDVTLDGLIDAAHRRRPGFDEDVRAVARVLRAYGEAAGEPAAMAALRSRFADRIGSSPADACPVCDTDADTTGAQH